MDVIYKINGVDFKDYGVFVSASDGIMNAPKLKQFASFSWDDYHGDSVDLDNKYYESREINLTCFIAANTIEDFVTKLNSFKAVFRASGTHRLHIEAVESKPLIYEVYVKDEIDIQKKWSDDKMIGTFKLTLIEPEPVKRVLRFERTSPETAECDITISTDKLVNIYWGDGANDFDVAGSDAAKSHTYANNGVYYISITGDIGAITEFTTNATTVWSEL